MLSLILTYRDSLYIATELGALVLVLVLSWIVPRFGPHGPRPPAQSH